MSRRSRWSLPVLRVGMGLFLVLWGVDKLAATEGSLGISSHFYGLDVGALVVQAAGVAEILSKPEGARVPYGETTP